MRVYEAPVRDELDDLIVARDAAAAEPANGADALGLVRAWPLERYIAAVRG